MEGSKGKAVVLAVLVAASSIASADQVEFNGIVYSCDNHCVVTVSGTRFSVRDCCGGRVRFVLG